MSGQALPEQDLCTPILTVVIPMWNSERYILRTLASLNQPMGTKMRILCIDDGSEDNTVSLCIRAAQDDTRIRVIQRRHTGVSQTRNAGIIAADTEYIMFLDSDDVMISGFFTKAVVSQLQQGYDMVGFGWQTAKQLSVPERVFESSNSEINGGYAAVRSAQRHFAAFFYRREFLYGSGLQFHPEVQYNEDEVFLTQCLYLAHRIRLCSQISFSNMLHEDSLRHVRFPGMGEQHLFKVWEYAWHYFAQIAPADRDIRSYCLEKLDRYIPKMCAAKEFTPELERRYHLMCRDRIGYTSEAIQED